jgi:3'-5' exoribonuclease
VYPPPGGKASHQVDDAAERRFGLGSSLRDDGGDRVLVKQVGPDQRETFSRLDPIELSFDDPRDDHSPVLVEQALDHSGPKSAGSSGDDCGGFHGASVRPPLYLRKAMKVRQFADGSEVAQALLVREQEVRRRRDGGDYLKLVLGDRTGSVPAIVRDDVSEVRELCQPGEIVHVRGRYSVHPRFGPQLALHSVRAAVPHEYSREDLVDGPNRDAEQMEADLRELIATVQNQHLQRLLALIFGEGTPTWASYRDAPAAKRYHQAYRHGLLEHSLSVAQAVGAISATFPGIDRDVAVTGALLHDIGKLEAYELHGGAVSMSIDGRLYGEIPLGYYRVRRAIERLDGFPTDLEQALLHIILSHHGSLEHGSPVVPCTREATLVHMIDNLGGRLGSFDRLEQELAAGERWSAYDKGIGGGAYFAARPEEQREAA